MIYSPAFDGLPEDVRARIWKRLYEVLAGPERQAIVEILRETKTGLPSYWR